MKKVHLLSKYAGLAFLAAGLILSSCNREGCTDTEALNYDEKAKEDDGSCLYDPSIAGDSEVIVTTNITADETWFATKTYILGGRITVESGATLTIEPGTVIKGQAGTGANATALLIARGGKLMAEGTAEKPIIFTSVADEIVSGQIESPNLEPTVNGLWGGVLILGKAPISASNDNGDVSEVQIEGIPTSDPNGLYGGSDPADNSGVIKYISIRHGGTNIGAGNEINGLTLGGVGTGTVIENVEIVANQDDGIEWFGGTVNVKNAVVWNSGDDAIDTDQDWTGTLDNFIVVTPLDHCFELDGPEGTRDQGGHIIKNGTVVASSNDRISSDLINTDANTAVRLENIHIMSIADGQVINRTTDNPNTVYVNITLDLSGNSSQDINDYIKDGDAPSGITAGGSPKADASAFANWTWAAVSGGLAGL